MIFRKMKAAMQVSAERRVCISVCFLVCFVLHQLQGVWAGPGLSGDAVEILRYCNYPPSNSHYNAHRSVLQPFSTRPSTFSYWIHIATNSPRRNSLDRSLSPLLLLSGSPGACWGARLAFQRLSLVSASVTQYEQYPLTLPVCSDNEIDLQVEGGCLPRELAAPREQPIQQDTLANIETKGEGGTSCCTRR